jgi:hypothetical protein
VYVFYLLRKKSIDKLMLLQWCFTVKLVRNYLYLHIGEGAAWALRVLVNYPQVFWIESGKFTSDCGLDCGEVAPNNSPKHN